MRVHEAEVPSHSVLCARRLHATGNGAREFGRRDGVRCGLRDRQAVLVHEVPAQQEGLIYPVLGLEVRSQQGGREILAADVAPHPSALPLPRFRVALHPFYVRLPCLIGPNAPRDAPNYLHLRDVGPKTQQRLQHDGTSRLDQAVVSVKPRQELPNLSPDSGRHVSIA